MGRVQDKVVLVSAAGDCGKFEIDVLLSNIQGQGIGRASCLFLAKEGAKVVF